MNCDSLDGAKKWLLAPPAQWPESVFVRWSLGRKKTHDLAETELDGIMIKGGGNVHHFQEAVAVRTITSLYFNGFGHKGFSK